MIKKPSWRSAVIILVSIGVTVSIVSAASSTAPAADFFATSWDKTTAADPVKVECTTTEGPVKIIADLTDEQKGNINLAGQIFKKFNLKESTILNKKDSKLTTSQDKLSAYDILVEAGSGTISNEEGLQKVKALKTRKFLMFTLTPETSYYASTKGKWKSFVNKEFSDAVLAGVNATGFTSEYEKDSFSFKGSGAKRLAQYNGTLTPDATKSLVTNALSEEFYAEGQVPASAKVFIEESTGLWKKIELISPVQTTLIQFPIKKTCNVTYKNIDVQTPSSATAGSYEEFGQILQQAQ